jgi:hypothetical protein
MPASSIRFCWPSCRARTKAPIQLRGQGRDCPGCGERFVVPRFVPADAAPILVLIEGEERCSLGVAYRRSA